MSDLKSKVRKCLGTRLATGSLEPTSLPNQETKFWWKRNKMLPFKLNSWFTFYFTHFSALYPESKMTQPCRWKQPVNLSLPNKHLASSGPQPMAIVPLPLISSHSNHQIKPVTRQHKKRCSYLSGVGNGLYIPLWWGGGGVLHIGVCMHHCVNHKLTQSSIRNKPLMEVGELTRTLQVSLPTVHYVQ